MNKNLIMLSGIPRSGSQVLASLLNQHPDIHATTTSPVIDLLDIVDKNWINVSAALTDRHPAQYGNIISGILSGAYQHIDESIVIDKNRLWPRFGPLMKSVLGHKPKIICTIRPIPEILSSFILLINKNSHKTTYIDQALIDLNLPINTKNRCKILWENYLIHPYTSLRIGYQSTDVDLCIVSYDEIVTQSQFVADKICNFIGISTFDVELSKLQAMNENDDFHGGLEGLHAVRSQMKRTSLRPEHVIGHDLTNFYTEMNLDFWSKPAPSGTKYLPTKSTPTTVKTNSPSTAEQSLPGDSLDYDLLYRATQSVAEVDGLICEIGVRRGGSLKYIIDAIESNTRSVSLRHIVALDPYGNIDYAATEQFTGKLDYTNQMKNEAIANLYRYVSEKNVNLVFFNLEDTEFFDKFEDGVPVYDQNKAVINHYALVFFDGPHDVASIREEIDFFLPRTNTGGVFVFDDVQSYPHQIIHEQLLSSGFELLEIGQQQRKISYTKIN